MNSEAEDRPAHLERYAEHARRLQTWIGAYGAGLATLLIYQFRTSADAHVAKIRDLHPEDERIIEKMIDTEMNAMQHDLLVALGLIALALVLQVLLLILNKWSQFVLANRKKSSFQYKAASWISDWYVTDFVLDVASLAYLAVATVHGLNALRVIWLG